MALAQIGPATNAMETLATAVGAGMLLGGFLVGGVAAVLGWPKAKLEEWTLSIGSGGGAFAVLLASVDWAMR